MSKMESCVSHRNIRGTAFLARKGIPLPVRRAQTQIVQMHSGGGERPR